MTERLLKKLAVLTTEARSARRIWWYFPERLRVPRVSVVQLILALGLFLLLAAGPAPRASTLWTSPLATPPETNRSFAGRAIRFDLPPGYHVLEANDGGCFLYSKTQPGFLVLYPTAGNADESLADLLNTTPDIRRTEPPLEVNIGGRTFVGLFVDTNTGDRLFLAAADGWALVAQGPVDEWDALAAGLNRVLGSLSFEGGGR